MTPDVNETADETTFSRDRELATLMQEGYREMAEETLDLAESNLPAAAETLPG
jgi:hypothetical protein